MSSDRSSVRSPRGCIKGIVLQSRLAFVRNRGGEPAVERFLDSLSPATRQLMIGIVLPMSWYPFEINAEIDHAIARCFDAGDAIYREMGERSASDALGGAHRNLVRSHDPHGLLKHSAQIHNLYYDSGYRTYEYVDATNAILRTFECRSFSREDCLTNLGWHQRALELCGADHARVVEAKCRVRGDRCCETVCAWR